MSSLCAGTSAAAPSRRMHQSVIQVVEHDLEIDADDDDGPHQGLGVRNFVLYCTVLFILYYI